MATARLWGDVAGYQQLLCSAGLRIERERVPGLTENSLTRNASVAEYDAHAYYGMISEMYTT